MVTAREKLLAAAEIPDPLKRLMAAAAVICGAFRDAGTPAVVVGGAAVEFYTAAQYLTGDIDMITISSQIGPTMQSLGFLNEHGTWVLDGENVIVVQFPKGKLHGSIDKVRPVHLLDGLVEVIGLEDIIVDRMVRATYWKDGSDEYALYMAAAHYNEVDWKYCMEAARRDECFEPVRRLRERARRQRPRQ
jgi:hypothetical protein